MLDHHTCLMFFLNILAIDNTELKNHIYDIYPAEFEAEKITLDFLL